MKSCKSGQFLRAAVDTAVLSALALGVARRAVGGNFTQRPLAGPNHKNSPTVLSTFAPLVSEVSRSTVRVRCGGRDGGYGLVVDPRGKILTRAGILYGEISCRLPDGRELPARLAAIDKDSDLALLSVDAGKLSPVRWADSRSLRSGSWMAAVGQSQTPLAVGVVSLPLQMVSPWPLSGYYAYLGIDVSAAPGGVKVDSVEPDSPAQTCGLHAGDVIVALNYRAVRGPEAFNAVLRRLDPGAGVRLEVERDGRTLELTCTTAESPFARGLGGAADDRGRQGPELLYHELMLLDDEVGVGMVDVNGGLVAVTVSVENRGADKFAMPAHEIEPIVRELLSGKHAPSAADLARLNRT
jgi:S1-C subfamily serine protease